MIGHLPPWLEANHLVDRVHNSKNEFFKILILVQCYMTRELALHGLIVSRHRENPIEVGHDAYEHAVYHYNCCDEVYYCNGEHE